MTEKEEITDGYGRDRTTRDLVPTNQHMGPGDVPGEQSILEGR